MTRGLQPMYDRVPNKVSEGGLAAEGVSWGRRRKE